MSTTSSIGEVFLYDGDVEKNSMINYEIKSHLAKLLATEDLVVEHQHVDTAQFNVETRVLTLPLWKKASSVVYDMLVGHEVGHALFTPNRWDFEIPRQFVNVCEDIRIEKLMKRKYPGIAKTFYVGYNALHDEDFFEIDGEDLTTFNLADRINIHAKVGSFVDVAFSTAEEPIVRVVDGCETFDDVLFAAELLYKFCIKEQEKEQEEKVKNHEQAQMFYDECMENAGIEDYPPIEEEIDSSDSGIGSELEVITDTAFEKGAQQLNDFTNNLESLYVEIPKIDLDIAIASNLEIHSALEDSWSDQLTHYTDSPIADFSIPDNQYEQFKNSAQKEVNYLVKEFESKKAADAYARSNTARTGILDCSKLHTYKFNEDLFKKVTTLSDGKNHGLIFILDWSGSMSRVLEDTMKQLYNLVWFCSKVQIPFDVYAFTDNYNHWKHEDEILPRMKKEEGKLYVNKDFSLMNIFTSQVSRSVLERQMKSFWRVVSWMQHSFPSVYTLPGQFMISGTPLHESLITLHQIIPKFKKENRVQKVQCVILTDGESNPLPYNKIVKRHWEDEPFMGCRNIRPLHTYLRNRKTGHTYQFQYQYWQFTEVLLEDLKETFPDTNFIGIRLLSSGEFGKFVRRYDSHIEDRVIRQARKDKCYITTDGGYHSYFGILSSSLFNDESFEVEDDASKSKIKNAFIKSLKNKKLNKKILGEFIDLVA